MKVRQKIISYLCLFLFCFGGCLCRKNPVKPEVVTSLQGVVVDHTSGNRLSGVEVEIDGRKQKSDLKGKYCFANLNPGTYELKARKEKYLSFSQPIELKKGVNSYQIVLTPAPQSAYLQGIVRQEKDGSPLADVLVIVSLFSHPENLTHYLKTKADGGFMVDKIQGVSLKEKDEIKIVVLKRGYERAEEKFKLKAGQNIKNFALKFSAWLKGKISDAYKQPPEDGVEAEIEMVSIFISPPVRVRTLSQPNGYYIFQPLPLGSYTIFVKNSAYKTEVKEITIQKGENQANFKLIPNCLKGKVKDEEGNSLVGVTIHLYELSFLKKIGTTYSDVDGNYFLRTNSYLEVKIRALKEGYQEFSTILYDLKEGENKFDWVMRRE